MFINNQSEPITSPFVVNLRRISVHWLGQYKKIETESPSPHFFSNSSDLLIPGN